MPRAKMDPKSKQILIIIVGIGVIGAVVGVSFVLTTQAANNENYLKTIQSISDQSRTFTLAYEDSLTKWQGGEISKEEILQLTEGHLENLDRLLTKLKSMEPPEKFRTAHELGILSLSHETQSDRHMRNYIETGNEDEYKISAELLQKAFDYETQAFEEFSRAGKST